MEETGRNGRNRKKQEKKRETKQETGRNVKKHEETGITGIK